VRYEHYETKPQPYDNELVCWMQVGDPPSSLGSRVITHAPRSSWLVSCGGSANDRHRLRDSERPVNLPKLVLLGFAGWISLKSPRCPNVIINEENNKPVHDSGV
jgi:hypothetical protein